MIVGHAAGTVFELVPHVFGAAQRPTGARGLFAQWRFASKVIDVDAFRRCRCRPPPSGPGSSAPDRPFVFPFGRVPVWQRGFSVCSRVTVVEGAADGLSVSKLFGVGPATERQQRVAQCEGIGGGCGGGVVGGVGGVCGYCV